jgi:hypothetical protein
VRRDTGEFFRNDTRPHQATPPFSDIFMPPFFRFIPFVIVAFTLSFFLAGCGGGHERESEPAVTLGPNGNPLPLMGAKGAFFNGTLLAEIGLSQSRGKGGFHPAPIYGMPEADDQDPKITPELVDTIRSRRAESPLPPIVMWLQLTSTASNTLNIEIVDFNSDLGNFAVQPEKVSLTPGNSVETEPMISRLGVTSLDIPVTVTLRIDGETETHVLTLRPVESAKQPTIKP